MGDPVWWFDAVASGRPGLPYVGKKVNTSLSSLIRYCRLEELSYINDLKRVLKTDLKDQLARSLVRYMLAYSLGRSLDHRRK